MKNPRITTLILTKNRAKLLSTCLHSLLRQTHPLFKIIIIDNNSDDETLEIISKYQRRLPIEVYTTAIAGYSELYNFGYKKAKNTNCDIIAILDDDCIADKNWSQAICNSFKMNKRAIYQGNTRGIIKNDLFSEIMSAHYENWIKVHKKGKYFDVIDNKNIAIPNSLFDEIHFLHNLKYGSEDIELGKRLVKKKINIIFVDKMQAMHHERNTLKEFALQHLRIAKAESRVDKMQIKKDHQVGGFLTKKTFLNLVWMVKKMLNSLQDFDLVTFFELPFIYALLGIIRIYGYYIAKN